MTGRELVDIPAEQIANYGPETVIEWLLARNAQHCTRLRAICESMRADLVRGEQTRQRLRAALPAAPAP
ncbi:hypothetical protein AB0E25_33285 [Streptomyces bobili]|uniref:hypothetical protein n=1 Tax=Streptomyces bobili TaxID=67280 RepID=UPI0033C9F8E3